MGVMDNQLSTSLPLLSEEIPIVLKSLILLPMLQMLSLLLVITILQLLKKVSVPSCALYNSQIIPDINHQFHQSFNVLIHVCLFCMNVTISRLTFHKVSRSACICYLKPFNCVTV